MGVVASQSGSRRNVIHVHAVQAIGGVSGSRHRCYVTGCWGGGGKVARGR